MIKKYTIATLLLSAALSSGLRAERYETIATGSYSWMDPAAWVNGNIPIRDIKNKDTVIIHNEVVLMTSLGIKNGAQLTVAGTLVVFNPNGGIVLENKGDILVDGTIRVLPGLNGIPNILDLDKGEVVINGTIENIGSEIYNDADIVLNADGVLRNFGYRDATDDLIIRTEDNDTYNLYVFASDLFGYFLDPSSIIGGIGGPFSTVPPDSINYSALTWTCYAGSLENDGSIVSNGGILDESECGGGMLSGTGDFPAVAACIPASNLRVTGTNATGLTFRWDAVPGAYSYIAAFKPAGSPRYRITRPVNGGATSIAFARNFFPAGIQIEWAVLTVCTPGELDFDLLAEGGVLQLRTADPDAQLDNLPSLSVHLYPNPVSELLFVEAQNGALNGQISLYDLSGRQVLQQPLGLSYTGQKLSIPVQDLEPGLYTLKINDGSLVHQETLMISR